MKKFTLFIIMVFMITSCGGGNATNDDPVNTPLPTVAPSGNETPPPTAIPLDLFGRPLYDDEGRPLTAGFTEVPMNLGGRIVNILAGGPPAPASNAYPNFVYAADIDRTPNETLEIMDKMRLIEQDYNVTFEYELAPRGSDLRHMMVANMAVGEAPHDILIIGTGHLSLDGVFPMGYLMDMNDPAIRDIINLNGNPWRPDGKLTVMGGRQFGVHFLIANSGEVLRSMFVFNRDFTDTYNLGNLYDMVWNKSWTFDAFESLCTRIVRESNGNILPVVFGDTGSFVHGIIGSNNGAIALHEFDGTLRFVAHENDNALVALDFIQRLTTQGLMSHPVNSDISVQMHMAREMMGAGQAMFLPGHYEQLKIFTRQDIPTDFSFGLLPFPMGPSADDYVAVTHMTEFYSIFTGVQRPDEIAAILVAMANRLSKLNIVETELNHGLQDMDSAEIMRYMIDRVSVDFSVLTAARHDVGGAVAQIISGGQTPRQAMESIAQRVQTLYDSIQFSE